MNRENPSNGKPIKIAVTGATGFIGHHVLDVLENYSVETIAIVRPNSNKKNNLIKATQIVELDLHDTPENAYEIMGSPDLLLHLAWSGLPNYHSLHHFELELPMQYRFLKKLIISGIKRLVVTGTCFEYGMQQGSLHEELETKPNNPYGFAKDMLRRQLEYLQKSNLFELTWARLFYLYGEGQAESSLYSQLKKAIQTKKKQFNMSGGEQLRDFLPVTEAARMFVLLALNKKDIGVVNICSGKPISIRRLVENWLHENNYQINLNLGYYPYLDYEPMAFWGNNKKLEYHLRNNL